MQEETVQIVRAYESNKSRYLIVVIPSEVRARLSIRKGTKFFVKIDESGRLIYERLTIAKESLTR